MLPKVGGWKKIEGGGGGVSVEEGSTSFTQYALQIQHSNDSNVEEKRFSFYKVLLLFLFFFKCIVGNLIAFFFKTCDTYGQILKVQQNF